MSAPSLSRPRLIPLFALAACATVYGQTDVQIEIDASRIQHAIPRTIYGTFLEPIGHSLYGGLWAQILENPSFEDNLWSARNIRAMVTQRREQENRGVPS